MQTYTHVGVGPGAGWCLRPASRQSRAIGHPRAAAWMVQLLTDGDAYVRLCAGTALRELTIESHRPMLREAFDRSAPTSRASLALALAKLREPVVLPMLTGMAQTNSVTL